VATLTQRAEPAGIEVIPLVPHCGDFNDDLRLLGATVLGAASARQLISSDETRFLAMSR
jgi:hypothetical protein